MGVYDVMRKNSGGFENMITMMNAGSDDNLAGGGHSRDGDGIQTFDDFTITSRTMPVSFWSVSNRFIAIVAALTGVIGRFERDS